MDSFVLRRLQPINQCYGNLTWEITQMFVEGQMCTATVLTGLPAGPARLPTRFTRLGFIHRERTAIVFFAVESLHSGLGRLALGHLHKAKAFGATGVPVGNHIDLVHGTILLEELAEVMICCTKRKVAYKDIHVQSSSS
jgi:hypothetical protein